MIELKYEREGQGGRGNKKEKLITRMRFFPWMSLLPAARRQLEGE